MSRKKYSTELKLKVIAEHESSGISLYKLAKKYNIEYSCVRRWVYNHEMIGPEAITHPHANLNYTAEFKKKVVEEYLQGGVTIKKLAVKHGIFAPSTLGKWIKQYNNHEELTDSRPKGSIDMVKENKARKTTLKERIEIVSYCIQNDKDYALAAKRYQVSYGQVYSWVKRYQQDGPDGLVDRRGKKKPEETLTETERLQMENRLLKAEIKKKQMEIDLLKKVREIEGR